VAPADPAGRVNWLTQQLFARPASPNEIALATAAIAGTSDEAKAWEQLCHALLCSNEFAFVD
jgi:hypothetical protein